jgi:hypothetical protein
LISKVGLFNNSKQKIDSVSDACSFHIEACPRHADSTPVSHLSANSVQINADKLQALFRQTPPDQKVANEMIRYKQAKGRLPTSLS